jgi:hypothetical protein
MFLRLFRLLAFAGVCVVLLCACAAKPVLIAKSAMVPGGIDLSGAWLVQADPASVRPSGLAREEGIRIPAAGSQRSQPGRNSGGGSQKRGLGARSQGRKSGGASAQIFLEYGESLKITQTEFGLFISYDRSVVEEYTFGENRLVSVGPIEAQRVSGWEEAAFTVETLDETGAILFETWHLESDGDVLVRNIRISKGEKDSFVHRQVFDRQ